MKYTFLIFSLPFLISCNQQLKKQSDEEIEKPKIDLKENSTNDIGEEKITTINYIELDKLIIQDGYQSNSTLSDFRLKFTEIDTMFYSIDEMGDGDTITTFITNGSRFNYFNSVVSFSFLDLSEVTVEYQGFSMNSAHIDSLANLNGISFEYLEVSRDSLNNEVKKAWFNTQLDKLTDEQIILTFVEDRLEQIGYFNGND